MRGRAGAGTASARCGSASVMPGFARDYQKREPIANPLSRCDSDSDDEKSPRSRKTKRGSRGSSVRKEGKNRSVPLVRANSGFDVWDINQDGKVDDDELAFMQKAESELGRLDKSQNGNVEKDEWEGSAEKFESLDLNNDGVIDGEEFRQGQRLKGEGRD